MKADNKSDNQNQDMIMKNLMKENEILSKVIKNKITVNEALNELLKILMEQRNYIENISDDHLMLENSISRLNGSIGILQTQLKSNSINSNSEIDISKINNAAKITYKPNEAISFSKLNQNYKITNNNIKVNHSQQNIHTKADSIDCERLLQMSISDFKKRKLKPINKK